jgi:hypothetical protein
MWVPPISLLPGSEFFLEGRLGAGTQKRNWLYSAFEPAGLPLGLLQFFTIIRFDAVLAFVSDCCGLVCLESNP